MLPQDPEERLEMFRIMARQAAGIVELSGPYTTPEEIEARAREAAARTDEEWAALAEQAREEVKRMQQLGRPLTEAEEL